MLWAWVKHNKWKAWYLLLALSLHLCQLDRPRPNTWQEKTKHTHTSISFYPPEEKVITSMIPQRNKHLTLGPGSPLSPLRPGIPTPTSPWQQKQYVHPSDISLTFHLVDRNTCWPGSHLVSFDSICSRSALQSGNEAFTTATIKHFICPSPPVLVIITTITQKTQCSINPG